MGSLALSDKTLNKYFHFLRILDINSKERLIVQLRDSIDTEKSQPIKLESIYGAWDDNRESDEIIREIKESRINPKDIERFE
jgi:hypothetical protein